MSTAALAFPSMQKRTSMLRLDRQWWPLLLVGLCAWVASPARAQQQAPASAASPSETDSVKHVTYLPESVKAEFKEELKQEVLDQAKREGWASPDSAAPSWTRRFRFSGDVRARFERDLFGVGNANSGEFPDFNAINTGSPFDVNFVDIANERYLNVDQARTRPRLRARLGLTVDLGQGFSTGMRLASGDGSTPVSTNQTLGGSGGNFSKYQIWLDQAFIRYEPIKGDPGRLALSLGRFENPFFTFDFVWDEDLNVDGVAFQGELPLGGGFRPFLSAGAFPVFTTAFAFSPEQTAKFPSLNKWLYAAQLGADWRLTPTVGIKFGAAFYYFHNIEGRQSDPCDTNLKTTSCNTDESRPSFAQKGNTYFAIRTPSAAALLAEATSLSPRYQYFGLASHFRELVGTVRFEVGVSEWLKLTLDGEGVRNFGFSPSEIGEVALNNRGHCDINGNCPYVGGRNGYEARFILGSPTQSQQWDWNASAAYRYLESDAVVDAFADSDFGLGGTNLRGYILTVTVWVANNVSFRARWLSANQIVGPTYHSDALQLDMMARF